MQNHHIIQNSWPAHMKDVGIHLRCFWQVAGLACGPAVHYRTADAACWLVARFSLHPHCQCKVTHSSLHTDQPPLSSVTAPRRGAWLASNPATSCRAASGADWLLSMCCLCLQSASPLQPSGI